MHFVFHAPKFYSATSCKVRNASERVISFYLLLFRDFLGPSVGGFLLDNVGFNNMCNYTAGLCLAMVSTGVNLVGFYRCGGHLENLKQSSILECLIR